MPDVPDLESNRPKPAALQQFFDCVARALAKRWLRDQRTQTRPQIVPETSAAKSTSPLTEVSDDPPHSAEPDAVEKTPRRE